MQSIPRDIIIPSASTECYAIEHWECENSKTVDAAGFNGRHERHVYLDILLRMWCRIIIFVCFMKEPLTKKRGFGIQIQNRTVGIHCLLLVDHTGGVVEDATISPLESVSLITPFSSRGIRIRPWAILARQMGQRSEWPT